MMGGSCSTQRRRPRDRNVVADGSQQQRRGCHRGRPRSRSFSSAVGRLCGGSQDSSDDESMFSADGITKRAARHSVDAEVTNQSISHLYPPDDNYQPHPTNPTLRCPKSLTDLCIDTICRDLLPNLDGELPSHLPQDIVDKIVASLTSHAALNSTTLKALCKCELGSLSLANCRGVSDEWLIPLTCSSNSSDDPTTSPYKNADGKCGGAVHAATNASGSNFCSSPPLRDIRSSSVMMDLDDYDDFGSPLPYPPPSHLHYQDPQGRGYDEMEDDSRSTSSFVSASSTPYAGGSDDAEHTSPLLPGVLPPPDFFSTRSSPLWFRGSTAAPAYSSLPTLPNLASDKAPPLPPSLPVRTGSSSMSAFQTTNDALYPKSFDTAISSTASTLSLLDLRGSQRLTDRGLLQLAHTPLNALEVVKLDNCHGITGRGLLAFSRSHRLHTLSLSNCRRLTDEAMVNVSHLGSSLMALNLGGCRCLTDRSLEAMANMIELRKLDLSQCDLITDDGLIDLEGLQLIEELSLGWCRLISDIGLEVLVAQPNRSKTLSTLRLARCSITDAGLKHLEKLESLAELDLNGCVNISSAALGDAMDKLTLLTCLDASYCPGILRSSWQGKINALKSLELCYSGVRDSHLSRLRSLPMLEELNLDSCMVGDWGIAHLVDNNVVPNLTTLDLADTDISDAGMSKIAQLNIRHLSLFYCNISNRGLRHIASMSNLEVLNLDSRDIGDEGLKYLRGLPLKSLDLFSSRVTDLGCAYLSKIKTLTSLELCGGGVGDLGCQHLATISNLTSLNLSQNETITNRGAASLAALSNLKTLNLSNTCVNSDALKFFGGLLKLQSLALYGCNDMEDSPRLNSLQSELPSLRCLRLNSPSNEDGVIDNQHETGEDGEEHYDVEDSEGDSSDYEEFEEGHEAENDFNDAEGLDRHSDGNGNSVGSNDDGSMSDFQDAYHEVQSLGSSEGRDEDMDYEV